MYMKEQFGKLPKWAQSEIIRLEKDTDSLQRRVSEFLGVSGSNTYLVDGMDKKPLQNNAHIEFMVGENQVNRVAVHVSLDGVIDVNTDSRIGQHACILPRAANSFYISFI